MSRIRNRVIVLVLRELGLVEEWGTGYSRIVRACEEGGYPTPAWQELSAVMRVSFLPHPDVNEEDREADSITVSETVNDTIYAGLKARGLIMFVGAPKTGHYRLGKSQ